MLEKLLNDEIRGRAPTTETEARVLTEEVQAVLRCELKQLTCAEVVEHLVEMAKRLHDARRFTRERSLVRAQPAHPDLR